MAQATPFINLDILEVRMLKPLRVDFGCSKNKQQNIVVRVALVIPLAGGWARPKLRRDFRLHLTLSEKTLNGKGRRV
jgi:hypothetical protein